jgi:hypothetical protein
VRLPGLGQLKKCNGLIGTRTPDLPACSIAPQPTTLRRDPLAQRRYYELLFREGECKYKCHKTSFRHGRVRKIFLSHNKGQYKDNMDKKTVPISNNVVRGNQIQVIKSMAINLVLFLLPDKSVGRIHYNIVTCISDCDGVRIGNWIY